MASHEDVLRKVSSTLVEALNIDEDEIKPASTLAGDLGAESIDFLDIVFRLEREFGIKIPREELFPEVAQTSDIELLRDGKYTAKGLAELKKSLPFANFDDFEKNPEAALFGNLFTVDMTARFVQDKLVRSGKA